MRSVSFETAHVDATISSDATTSDANAHPNARVGADAMADDSAATAGSGATDHQIQQRSKTQQPGQMQQ